MLTAFLIGLFSALHCFGMCAGIVGALTMSLHPDIRARQEQLALYHIFRHLTYRGTNAAPNISS